LKYHQSLLTVGHIPTELAYIDKARDVFILDLPLSCMCSVLQMC